MFEDARRYLQMGFDAIKHHCLNTYHPVLMWLPRKSLMCEKYRTMLSSGPQVLAGLIESWGPMEHAMHHPGDVCSAFSNDGTRVVSGLMDNTVRIWNATTGKMERILEGHSDSVRSIAFSSDGTRVASGSSNKSVLIWNGNTGEIEHVLEGHSDTVTSVAISDDGTRVVSGSDDHSIRIWNAATGDIERVLKGHSDLVNSVAISDDGTRVVSGSDDHTVRVWNVVTGKIKRVVEGFQFWKAATGKAKWVLNGHSQTVSTVAFSRDGTHIVSGSWDGTVRIWNAVTGEIERIFQDDWIQSVAFSPDGTHVVAGSWIKPVLVWDIITGESTSLPYSESFQFPDKSNVTHILPGEFQLFTPGQQLISLSPDKKWILTDRSNEGCWIPPEFRDFVSYAISGSKLCLGFRSGRVVIVNLMPPH